ncbi:MAG: HD domain-containing protein [Proteobacteria bacterium]|nr:HD domain-containing protein [Pseudomonadota bacterium]MBU1688806.1 HD domain-containing protein [Pseudomonadota bacterium]
MENFLLKYDVHSIRGELLLPSGAQVDESLIAEFVRNRNDKVSKEYYFAELGSPLADLTRFLAKPPYNAIFSDPAETEEILAIMGQVRLLEPVIDSLDYFREKDFHTYRHSLMVFALSTLLARHLYPNDRTALLGSLAGPSHDLGKSCVHVEILQKKTPLTRPELAMLKHHVFAGYIQLSFYTGDPRHLTAQVARDHHERRDCSGYPRGTGNFTELVEIAILSDIYDALISPRPYRPVSYDNRSALEELTKMAEKGQVGWLALKALVAFNRRNRPDYQECEVSLERRGMPPANNVYGLIAEENDGDSGGTGS